MAPIVYGYRGIAKTKDFHTWVTSDDNDRNMPNGVIWSPKDCQGWSVSWDQRTGCIGGGHASSLITEQHTYMLIKSSDKSLSCTAGQNWVIGLVRAPHFVASGNWQQLKTNPLLNAKNGVRCAIQYPRLFKDSGNIYLSYWLFGPTGAHDQDTYFYIDELRKVSAFGPLRD